MLLRLLPIPSATTPNPPTILFTLSLPTHPYTSRSLPLPPNLLAHCSVCWKEGIDCPNVLLGEKSCWITGAVDDVTFSLSAEKITIHLIDGAAIVLPLSESCKGHLHRVCKEVELSFAPGPEPKASERPTNSFSDCSPSSASSSKGFSAPSSPVAQTPPALHSPSSTRHFQELPSRKPAVIAASLAADCSPSPSPCAFPSRHTYRRFVLPQLKEQLTSAYLPWAIASETADRIDDLTP